MLRYGDTGFAVDADDELRARLAHDPHVRGVQQDQVVTASDEAPSNVRRIHGPEAHAAGYKGKPTSGVVRVAIVDTGIDLHQADLVPNLDTDLGKDCTGTGSFDDDHYHGTHVAGTVAAVADGNGVLGVAPEARLVPVKVLDGGGSGTWAEVACGLQHVLDLVTDGDPDNDVQVVNMSLGGYGGNPASCADDVLRNLVCQLTAHGVAVAVAAGNNSEDAAYHVPAAYPEAITVSALDDRNDQFAYFSNFGRGIDVVAPGVSVTSTARGGGLSVLSGTSMATPAVAGTLAVLRAADPGADVEDLLTALQSMGECPDHSSAGADRSCDGQGTWSGDPDGIVEPLVRVDDAAASLHGGRRFTNPIRGQAVHGVVPVRVHRGDDAATATVEVRVDGGPWLATTDDPATGDAGLEWDTDPLPEGSHLLEARVTGATTAIVSTTPVVRRRAAVSITAPAASGVYGGDLPVRAHVTHPTEDPATLALSLRATPAGAEPTVVPMAYDPATGDAVATLDTRPLPTGTVSLEVRATDSADRVATATRSVSVDNRPRVSITAPYGTLTGPATIRATVSSPAGRVDDLDVTWATSRQSGRLTGAAGAVSGTIDSTLELDGSTLLTVTAKDPGGRTGTAQAWLYVHNGPQIALTADLHGTTLDLTATVTSSAYPASAIGVSASAGGRGPWDLPWDGTTHVAHGIDVSSWPEGSTWLVATATDPAGRVATAGAYVTISRTPRVTITAPSAYATVSGRIDVRAALSDIDDAAGTLSAGAYLDSGTPTPLGVDAATGVATGTLDSAGVADGWHSLYVTARDPAGHVGSLSQSVYVSNKPTVGFVRPVGWPTIQRGVVPVEVRASSTWAAPAALTVVATPSTGPAMPLHLDAVSGSFVGSWDTTQGSDGAVTLTVTVTDPRGGTAQATLYLDVENHALVDIVEPAYDGASGVTHVYFRVVRADGSIDGLDATWRIDAGPARAAGVDPHTADMGYRIAMLDTTALADGHHTIGVDVTDAQTGVHTTVTRGLVVHQTGAFGVGITSPTRLTQVNGAVTVEAVAYGGRLRTTAGAQASAWYRIDGGPWNIMSATGGGHFRAVWATGATGDGDHAVDVMATDWGGGLAESINRVTVFGSQPLRIVATAPGTVDGVVTLGATVEGGALVAQPDAPVSLWYRVGTGAWSAYTGPSWGLTARWDTAAQLPGRYNIQLVATDYLGSVAYGNVVATVADRAPLAVTLVTPTSGARVGTSIAVTARAVSRTVLLPGISVWAKAGNGPIVALTLGADGLFHGTVRAPVTTSGASVAVSLVATDYKVSVSEIVYVTFR